MRRLRILIAALTIAVTTWQAHALSITVDADLMKDGSGNPMPTNGLVLLVASTGDQNFNDPTPLSFVSGDDIIVGRWDLRSWGEPGAMIDFTNTTTVLSSSNPLRLYWYPTLNINSTAPGQNTAYGTYRDTADPSQQAIATATLSGSGVSSIAVNSGGGTYHSVPSVTFTNGGGTGATATAVLVGGVVTAINVNNAGSGYTNAPQVIVSAPAGLDGSAPWFGANASASINLRFITTDADSFLHAPGSNPSSAGLATSNTPTAITVNSQPASATQNYGGTATFSIDATGASIVYQWRKNGANMSDSVNVSGSTTSALTLSSVTANDAASYTVYITNSAASVTSSTAILTVIDPSITGQPTSTTVNATTSASFSVAAVGSGSLTYQWKKGAATLSNGVQGSGAVVSGATSSAVTISGVQQTEAGNYTVLVTGSGGTTTSSTASLTVTDVAPVFSTPAADSTTTLSGGDTLTLAAAATGSTPLTYHWKKGVSNLADGAYANGAIISGATTANLTLTGVLAADAGVYVCNAHNAAGDTLSYSTTLIVNEPIITAQPSSFTAECNDTWPCLSVTAVGSTNLTYQWFASATAITDATNASYYFGDTSFGSAGSYSVVVSNVYGNSITSSVVTVTVQDSVGPFINVIGGHTAAVCQGSAYSDSGATAFDDCDGLVSVTPSGSVDTNTLGAYTITYTASDSHGNISTDTRVVTVQACVVGDPAITSQPANLTVVTGQKLFSMTVGVTGTPSTNPKLAINGGFHFQWHWINTNLIDKPLLNATNPTYTFKTAVGYGTSGTYYCVVTNDLGITNSDKVNFGRLTVDALLKVTGQPANVTKVAGNIATFKVICPIPAADTNYHLGGPVTFTWLKNGTVLPISGNVSVSNSVNASVLTIMNVQNPNAATYQCILSNLSPVSVISTNTKGILTVKSDDLNPVASILHPSSGLKYTNGQPALLTGVLFEPNGVTAPDLDIDGNAVDGGLITTMTLLRTLPPNSLSNDVTFVHRTNTAHVMLPGSILWTNHIVLVPGTNTFFAVATDSAGHTNINKNFRTYYYFTNVPVTINVNPPGYGTISSVSSFGFKPVEGANQLPEAIGFTITANPKLTPHRVFDNFTDESNNILGTAGVRTLKFTVTSNMVINANFH